MASLNRAEFLQAAAALALVRRLDLTPGTNLQQFASRPDLKPPRLTTRGGTGDFVFLAPSSGPGQRGAMIADGRGGLVWFHPTNPSSVMDFKVQRLHGKPVLTWWEGKSPHGIPKGEWVVADETYAELARFGPARGRNGDLHEFVISPENTALVACTEIVPWRHGTIVDGIVQELELPSGRLIREWRSLDHVGPDETELKARPGPRYDYFHVNSIDVAPNGNLLVGARNTWAAYELDRRTGRVLRRIGGRRSDVTFGPGARFWWQHDVRFHGGTTLTVFDNGAAPAEEKQSRALLLRDGGRHITLERAFVHRPQLVLSHYMGNAQLLPNGHMVVGWGGSPYVTEFAADGTIVFDAALPRGGQSYRAFRSAWNGRPTRPPDVAAQNGSVHVSWNGATGVASWQLVEDGRATQTVARTGFETALQPAPGTRRVAAVALDAAGAALARSATIEV
ncbi:MAG: arylsulfotransferase family protein [Actinomycetota bacterium]